MDKIIKIDKNDRAVNNNRQNCKPEKPWLISTKI